MLEQRSCTARAHSCMHENTHALLEHRSCMHERHSTTIECRSRFSDAIFHSSNCDRHYFLSDSTWTLAAHDHPPLHSAPPRSACLQRRLTRTAAVKSTQPFVFIVPFTPLSSIVPTRKVLLEHWQLLGHALPDKGRSKPIIAYQSAPSLAKSLVFAKEKLHTTVDKPAPTTQTNLNRFLVRTGPVPAAAPTASTGVSSQPNYSLLRGFQVHSTRI
jgi:hypothetical protein